MIDFPASPTPGQRFTAAGATWIFDGVKWLPEGLAPTVAPGINDNRIINGDMRIDQRNNGAGGTTAGYTVDRWTYATTQVGKISWGRLSSSNSNLAFPLCLGFAVSSAFTAAATDTFFIFQAIEADMVSDFAWGSPSAQPVTLSFWAQSNLTGTFSGAVRTYPSSRSYPFTFALPTTAWTKIAITIPGDTAAGWTMSGNLGALSVGFDLGSGANFRGPANVWAGVNYLGVTGAVSVVANAGAGFYVTGVKLEIGTVATPFNRQSLAKSLADCQRYYEANERAQIQGYYTGAATGWQGNSVPFKVVKRATPTIVPLSGGTYVNAGNLAAGALSAYNFVPVFDIPAAGIFRASFIFAADAEL